MALLDAQQIQITGPAISLVAAAAGGDTVTPDDSVVLWVKNGDGAVARTVTIATPPGLDQFGQDLPDIAVSVPASSERLIGPLSRRLANPSTRVVDISYDDETDLTVAAVRI